MNKAPRAQQQGNNNNNQNVGHSKASGCNVIVNPSAAPEVEDEGEDESVRDTESRRAAIVDSITKDERIRKKRMYLDGWDAALDRGKVKKVKGEAKRARPLESQSHRFQQIQASVQRMNRGRAKG